MANHERMLEDADEPPQATSADPIAFTAFETAPLAGPERFEVWRESLLPLFEAVPRAPDPVDRFQARMESFDLQQLFFGLCSFSPLRFLREQRHRPGGQEDHLLVQLYLEGGYTGYNGHRALRVGPGDICFLDLGRPLATRAKASRTLSLVVPRELLPFDGSPPAGAVLTAGSVKADLLGRHMLSVWHNLGRATTGDLPGINDMLLATIGSAFSDESGTAPDRVTLEAIQDFIAAELGREDLAPDLLCARFACSRARLYRLFEPLGGVAAYIRRMRLRRCLKELQEGNGNTRVVDVAIRWGFTNPSHFGRVFRDAFGMTPSEAIEQGQQFRQLATARPDGAESEGLPAFHDWLRRI